MAGGSLRGGEHDAAGGYRRQRVQVGRRLPHGRRGVGLDEEVVPIPIDEARGHAQARDQIGGRLDRARRPAGKSIAIQPSRRLQTSRPAADRNVSGEPGGAAPDEPVTIAAGQLLTIDLMR